jgi:hypothetical protein
MGAVAPFAIGCGAGAIVSAGVVFVVGRAAKAQHPGEHAVSPDEDATNALPVTGGRAAHAQATPRPAHARVARTSSAPSHASTADWEATGSIRVAQVPAQAPATRPAPASASQPAYAPAAGTPYSTSRPAAVPAADMPYSPSSRDDASSHRARRASIATRVADVLSSHIEQDKMDGLPVIERADGSVGDVGTSWWDDALDHDSKTGLSRAESRAGMIAELIPGLGVEASTLPGEDLLGTTATPAQPPVTFEHADVVNPDIAGAARIAHDRAAGIQSRLSDIDESVFPEERVWNDAKEDAWESALSALDEKVEQAQKGASAEDVIDFTDDSEANAIDEPDDLESETQFIPFRVPAGRPDVTDTDSYVDYLIDDEFSRNSSHAVRANAREYLHVIEGGTAAEIRRPTRMMPRHARPGYVPAHFSEETLVELGFDDEEIAQQA